MSKERELLKKILNTGWLNHELSCEAEELLAQPEQTEQEDIREVLQLGEPKFNAQITVKKDCKHKNNGRCYLHNLQCQYPECEE